MTKNLCAFLVLWLLTGCSVSTAGPVLPAGVALPPAAGAPTSPAQVVTLSTAPPLFPHSPPPPATAAAGLLVTLHGETSINLRGGPSPLYPVVGRAASGAAFSAVARSERGEWLLLAVPGSPGGLAWVYIAYTDYDSALHPLPVATPIQPAPRQ